MYGIGLLFAVACFFACATVINVLYSPIYDIEMVPAIIMGKVHQILFTEIFWKQYPSFPPFLSLIHLPTLGIIFAVVLSVTWLLRIRRRISWKWTGLVCLAFPVLLWACGLLMMKNNTNPSRGGVWCALVLLSSLFSMGVCIAYVVVDLVSQRHCLHRKTATRM